MNHFTSAHQNWTRKDQKISPQFSLYVAFKIQPLLFRLWLYEASADMELCAHRGRLRHGGLLGNDELLLSDLAVARVVEQLIC